MKRLLTQILVYLSTTLVISVVVFARYKTGSEWFTGHWLKAFTIISFFTGAAFLAGCYWRLNPWLSGQWENRFGRMDKRLARLVKFALVQQKVLQDRLVGYSHYALFVSFVLLFIWHTLPSLGIDLSWRYLPWLPLLYVVLILSSCLLIYARISSRVRRLRATARELLLPSLFVMVGLAYFASMFQDVPALRFTHVSLVLIAFSLIPYTKLTHVLAAPINILFGTLGQPGALVPPFTLSRESEVEIARNPRHVGVRNIRDFPWPYLISLDACTECARCDEVCPAFQTGDPLTPKGLVLQLRAAMRSTASSDVTNYVAQKELLSCTTCGACTEICPVLIDPVSLTLSVRRYLLFEGKLDSGHQLALQRTLEQYNPWGLPWGTRETWATGVAVEPAKETTEYDFLYWVGCAASFDERAQQIVKKMVTVLKRAGLSVAILGNREMCCGEFARKVGDEGLFQNLALSNIKAIASCKAKAVVTHCPHCLHALKDDYPRLGARFEVLHHSQVLAELLSQGKISLRSGRNLRIAYHDPCYLGRYQQIFDEPHNIISYIPGAEIIELKRSRQQSFCCGGGGARMWLETDSGERIASERAQEIYRTGADIVMTACPFCLAMLSDTPQVRVSKQLAVKDIVELVV